MVVASARHSPTGPLLCALVMLMLLLSLSSCLAEEPAAYVWLEAEDAASASEGFVTEAAGPAGLLSGGQWLRQSLDKDQAQGAVPQGGFVLRYGAQVPEAGEYELWARVGFEWARAPLEWRIGNGEWTRVGSEVQTTNVMELGEWMEVGWLQLGAPTLQAGATDVEIRYREPGGDGRMLMALDCIALTKGHFVPEGRLKPGRHTTPTRIVKRPTRSSSCPHLPPPSVPT